MTTPISLLPVEHFPQENDVGCLAACTQMALHHLGINTTQQQLNSLFETSKIGTPNWRVQRVENKYPVSVQIENAGDESTLINSIKQNIPPIIFVLTGELSHWDSNIQHALVVVGFDEDCFYINDPAFTDAPKAIFIDELMIAWIEFDTQFAILTT